MSLQKPPAEMDDDWWFEAACKEQPSSWWFPADDASSNGQQARAAKAICGECEVRPECLDFAQRARIQDGIWGALGPRERRRLRRRTTDVA